MVNEQTGKAGGEMAVVAGGLLVTLGLAAHAIALPAQWRALDGLAVLDSKTAEASLSLSSTVILFSEGEDPAVLARLLDGPVGLAVPVLDATGTLGGRADHVIEVLSDESVADALRAVAPLLARLARLPDSRASADARLLGILAYTLCREEAIAPNWAPHRKQAMHYPALFALASARAHLDQLRADGLLQARHAERLHACDACGGSRLNVAEHCPKCNATFLMEERVIHHYACGYQAPQSDFGKRGAMLCPKCGKRPRHFGVDYDAPGVLILCRVCEETADPPDIKFTCLDCGRETLSDNADIVDWFAYTLSDDGVQAARVGRLPKLHVEAAFSSVKQARNFRDFGQMLLHDLDVAARYDRPITFVRAKLKSVEHLTEEHGRGQVAEAFHLLTELVAELLRETDFLAVTDDVVLIAMPETDPKNARTVLDRLNQEVLSKIKINLNFETQVLNQEDAERFLRAQGLRAVQDAADGEEEG